MSQDRAALDVYRSHHASLVDYARVITGNESRAEDVVQDAWLRFRNACNAAAVREPLHYLYRIVRNLAVDDNRRAAQEASRCSGDIEVITHTVASEAPSPEDVAIARSELDVVRKALGELPERTRIAVEMHRFGGHTLAEIAGALGISVGLAHTLVADGIKHCHHRRNRSK
ncbi:RNA polymerase sigma-70 factor (ECF subfamily) [Sphingobium sp. B11D3B]|uniref:sigma-70 family RNA polymerase sigma factor n=1 Tax=Sphingobium sp. B11D3B TaxID=2940575 RepID=UPI0022262AB2|nr:sigma-70 family RNA polymerase sigma factor [Sphingobium sp. B11D3B]MCW2389649.1 RNA polymerase sigma-70 factor (ECF subfamily) [Sphingobium sp. B11D3B]